MATQYLAEPYFTATFRSFPWILAAILKCSNQMTSFAKHEMWDMATDSATEIGNGNGSQRPETVWFCVATQKCIEGLRGPWQLTIRFMYNVYDINKELKYDLSRLPPPWSYCCVHV